MKKLLKSLLVTFVCILVVGVVTANAAIDLNKYTVTSYEAPKYFSPEIMEPIGTIWKYEYSTNYNTDFKDMVKKLGLYVSDKDAVSGGAAELASPWQTDMYLRPGEKEPGNIGTDSINAVQTFVAPSNGYVTLRTCDVIRHYGYKDSGEDAKQDCEIAIYKNNEKIWPSGNGWQIITAKKTDTQPVENTVTVPELKEIEVKKGDKIRFVVGRGKSEFSNWNDYVKWYVIVDMYAANNKPVVDNDGKNDGVFEENESDNQETPDETPNETPSTDVPPSTDDENNNDVDVNEPSNDENPGADENDGLPVWAIVVIVIAAVLLIGGGVLVFLITVKGLDIKTFKFKK